MGDLLRFPRERHFDSVQSVRVDFCDATDMVVIDIRAFGRFSPHLLDTQAIIVVMLDDPYLLRGRMALIDTDGSSGTHYRFEFVSEFAEDRARLEFHGLCRFSNVKWIQIRQKGQTSFRTFSNRFFRRRSL